MSVTVSGLFRYPLKSGRRIELAEAEVVTTGIVGDREYMVVDERGHMVSQRTLPAMALLDPGEVAAACEPGELRPVEVWGWKGLGVDQGDRAARLVSDRLGRELRVVRFPRAHHRATTEGGGSTMYADGYPLLVASTTSLAEVNGWLDEPVPMERFRPSIVLNGLAAPFVEDDIATILIGDVVIDLVNLCARCVLTSVDQELGEKVGREPLRTLAKRRTLPTAGGRGVMFAVNAIPRTTGTIRVGDDVEVIMHELPYEQRIARSQ